MDERTVQRELRQLDGYRRRGAQLVGRHLRVRHFAGTTRHAHQLDEPIRIAHLTDQHVGFVTPMKAQEAAIDAIRAQEPDIVLLTGDYVSHSLRYLDALESLLSRLQLPAFATLGNHDHWADATEVRAALRRSNIEVLTNANTQIELSPGRRLQLIGVDDACTGHADTEKALKGIDPSIPSVALSHIGEEADRIWDAGVPLVLSGHTHSGHISVGKFHHLLIGHGAGHRYIHGLYGDRASDEAGAVYVSAGIGSSVFGFRVGERAKREVAIFDIGALPSSFEEHHAEQLPFEQSPWMRKIIEKTPLPSGVTVHTP